MPEQNIPSQEETTTPEKESQETTSKDVDISKLSSEELKSLAEAALASKRNANREAKELRLRLEKLEKDQNEATTRKLEEEKKFEELYKQEKSLREKMENTLKTSKVESALRLSATRAGIIDPSDTVLIDQNGVEFENGEPKNIDRLVENLKKSKPHLFKTDKQPLPPGSATGFPNSRVSEKAQRKDYYDVPYENRPKGKIKN